MEADMVVEIPAGSRNKYEMDHESGRINLDRTLFTATTFPTDYGYLVDTAGEDGDPLDAIVLLEEPTFPGCGIKVRPIGVFWMEDEDGPDSKLLCVPAEDPRWQDTTAVSDLASHLLAEIGHFFDVYKDLEPGKHTEVSGWRDRDEAELLLTEARDRYRIAAGTDTSASTR
ncbi:inorganic diphosphatase [Rugosimonospora africana]|uniref:Inorganic pyrophosphatase n=1 Tax=Rugosimonospora africana TaxID=556532 RepID=A0A8J3VPP9_9ACTN|nr:inorganic diphosphatase [Rugosimonospora africana]GIH14187.1 inorganic pyrophosphatase [Rugosimonospora africana]